MKYLKQFLIILSITFLGEVFKAMLPLPIPASIYGMILMFVGLVSGFIKPESVKDTGIFLIEIMPVMFIPAGVGLMESFSTLQPIILPVMVILAVTNITVMTSTGLVSQLIIKKRGKKKDG